MHDDKHILFIDDDASMIQMVRDIISLTHCKFKGYGDYHEGLREAIQNPPELILLDVHMGKVNGIDILKQLRKMKVTENIPVIMLTGDSQLDTVKKAQQLNISGYLLKPFKPASLIQGIEQALGETIMSPLKQTQLPSKNVGKAYSHTLSAPKKQRLMVLDDEPTMSRLISDILQESNLMVESYSDPHEALRQIMLKAPDVLLSDVNMPGLNGVEIARQLKKMRSTYQLPIVLMSGQELNQLPAELQQLEVEGFLQKPFTPMELVKTLQPFFSTAIF